MNLKYIIGWLFHKRTLCKNVFSCDNYENDYFFGAIDYCCKYNSFKLKDLLSNNHLTSHTLNRIARKIDILKNISMAILIIRHPNCDSETLDYLYVYDNEELKVEIVKNYKCPSSILRTEMERINYKDSEHARNIIGHRNCPNSIRQEWHTRNYTGLSSRSLNPYNLSPLDFGGDYGREQNRRYTTRDIDANNEFLRRQQEIIYANLSMPTRMIVPDFLKDGSCDTKFEKKEEIIETKIVNGLDDIEI